MVVLTVRGLQSQVFMAFGSQLGREHTWLWRSRASEVTCLWPSGRSGTSEATCLWALAFSRTVKTRHFGDRGPPKCRVYGRLDGPGAPK